MGKLEGKIAIVTGSGKGIGRDAALAIAAEGATVVTVARTQSDLDETVKMIEDAGGTAISLSRDLTDGEQVADMVKTVVDKYGRIDILVNNAGVSDSTPLDKYTAEHFANVMDLNVNAMMNGILPAAAIMKEQGGGCILNWSLARELGPFHIRVNAVAPGITRTDMVAALPKEMIDPLISHIPLRRIGEAEDIANAFLFLASDMASYITGEILSVDGAMRT